MGTINYKTSEIITVGMREFDFINLELECLETDLLAETIQEILNDANLYCIDVTINYGYYYGFSLDIQPNYDFTYKNAKKDILKDLNELKRVLLACIDAGLCVCYPGYCTSFLSKKESIKEINQTIAAEKKQVKNYNVYYGYLMNIIPGLDFTIKGKTYKEKQTSLENIAKEYQTIIKDLNLSYYELMLLNNYFEKNAKKYGCIETFKENAII